MSSLSSEIALPIWTGLWLAAAIYLMYRHWPSGSGVGLILGYVVSFGSLHWLSAALNLLPWYETWNPRFAEEGMRQSMLAILAFTLGTEIVRRRMARGAADDEPVVEISPVAVNVYLVAGVVMHVLLFPLARNIPSVNALVGTGSTLFVIGVGLKCWTAWQSGDRRLVWWWLAGSTLLPLFTVATQGFLGYGMAAMMAIFAFVAAFYGPRWRLIVLGALVGYFGLSIYVTYMRDRAEIRSVVWGGSNLEDRIDSVFTTLSETEWFDIYDVRHLNRIDVRLNQNQLIGAAAAYIDAGHVPFAYGATFADAALAVIPRALWPEKPTGAGSGDLVAIYTGIEFAEGTSVGIGQVMESYVNFGTVGVVISFLVLGVLIALIDRSAVVALRRGDVQHFTLWYLPGLSLLNLGGSFVEVTSSGAAGLVVAVLLNVLTRRMGAGMPADAPSDVADAPHEARSLR